MFKAYDILSGIFTFSLLSPVLKVEIRMSRVMHDNKDEDKLKLFS